MGISREIARIIWFSERCRIAASQKYIEIMNNLALRNLFQFQKLM